MTIALAVALELAPRSAAAVPSTAARPDPRALPTEPFSEEDDAGAAGAGARASGDTAGSDRDSVKDADQDPEGDSLAADGVDDEQEGTSLRALSCLEGEGGNEQDGARRGVQKRDFMKKRRVEIAALGGYYASDTLSSTYVYGAALSFFPSEDFGLELFVARNPAAFRLENAFNSFDRERHFQSGVAWNVLGAMVWSPIHAKLRWSERSITHADLVLLAGGGQTLHQTVQGVTFQVGAGLKLYLTRFISLRFDARDLMVPQEVLGRASPTHNVVITLGLCAWAPG